MNPSNRLKAWLRTAIGRGLLVLAVLSAAVSPAMSAPVKPDELISRVSTEVLDKIKSDPQIKAGDFRRISQFVDESIMPFVNFERMTALAVGRGWRDASAEQKTQLAKEFRTLLLRTYSGALTQVRDETIQMKPMRGSSDEQEVIVRSDIVGRAEPIQLNYRLEKDGESWKIFDINVLGVWLIETYRNQFRQIVNNDGVDGLIKTLQEKNQQYAQSSKT